jgi:hypothetical protein
MVNVFAFKYRHLVPTVCTLTVRTSIGLIFELLSNWLVVYQNNLFLNNENNLTENDNDICVRNSGHSMTTLHSTVLTQHVISCGNRLVLGEKYTYKKGHIFFMKIISTNLIIHLLLTLCSKENGCLREVFQK